MATTPQPKTQYQQQDEQWEKDQEAKQRDTQRRIEDAQKKQAESTKPPPPPKPPPPKENPLEKAVAEFKAQQAARQQQQSDAELAARAEVQKNTLNAAQAALDKMQKDYEQRQARNQLTSQDMTDFQREQRARQEQIDKLKSDFQASEQKRMEEKKKAAGQDKASQEQRAREEEKKRKEREEKEKKEQEKRDKEKKDWDDWNNGNQQDQAGNNNYPVELDSKVPDFGEINITKNYPLPKVHTDIPECKPLEYEINGYIDTWQTNYDNVISLFEKVSGLGQSFEESKEWGKAKWTEYMNDLRAMKALLESCKKVNRCSDPSVTANLARYAGEAATHFKNVQQAVEMVKNLLKNLKSTQEEMLRAYDTVISAGGNALLKKQDLIKCQSPYGKTNVSKKTEVSGSSGSEEDTAEDSTSTTSTTVAESGGESASESSGASGTTA